MGDKDILELIPARVGISRIRKKRQNRTLLLWTTAAIMGVVLFYQGRYPLPPAIRAAALGLIFPGAGYTASITLLNIGLLAVTWALVPVTLFMWFGAGGILFPALLWISSTIGAYFTATDHIFEAAGFIDMTLLFSLFLYWNRQSVKERKADRESRDLRNDYIAARLEKVDATAVPTPPAHTRELTSEELRSVQFILEEGLKSIDDFSNIDTVDQFQTSAIRYKLYERMYLLAVYQAIYVPNLRGYLTQSFRNTLEKSLQPLSIGFWKWECLWGKFTFDWDPVREDNIMVSGWFLKAVALYTALNADQQYAERNGIKFRVTDKIVYEYSIHSLSKALVDQWARNPLCLIPCEPNWIYTICNLYGILGQHFYDHAFGTSYGTKIAPKFEAKFDTEFTELSGRVLTICSQFTGFLIPGVAGVLSDLMNALLLRGHLDHIARRMWAIFREETVSFDETTGDVRLIGMTGADNIDIGNYKVSDINLFAQLAVAAGEFGEEPLRHACRDHLKRRVGFTTTNTGAVRLNPELASDIVNTTYTRSGILRHEDWKNLVREGPPKSTGPMLTSVPYPGVLVAAARSIDSRSLNLVLYPSGKNDTFELGVEGLQPNLHYRVNKSEQKILADERGHASFSVPICRRTVVSLSPT